MKIFGRGFIGSNLRRLELSKDFLVYAAGVSNSNQNKVSAYKKEINVLKKVLKTVDAKKKFIYISSLSVENKKLRNDRYVKNKLLIENLIKKNIQRYLIVRLPQIVGRNKNKFTLTNCLYKNIKLGKPVVLWKNSIRNLIDIDDIVKILKKYLKNKPKINTTINIFNPKSVKVISLIKLFSEILNKEVKIRMITRENKNINFNKLRKGTRLPNKYYKVFDKKNYIEGVLRKYYL